VSREVIIRIADDLEVRVSVDAARTTIDLTKPAPAPAPTRER
jgi:hypothetical protein